MPADPVTIELIRNALISVTGEMRTKIMRSAFSPIIYESLDFSVAFFNERAETLAQADGLPYFLCDLPNAVRAVIEDVGGVEHMRAGDVFLVNDHYRCSQHPQDVSIVKPAYFRGELFGFTAVRVHLIDLGGKAGFASTDATEIFQEGLVIPTVHLHREGRLNEEIIRLMAANSRMSRSTMLGDLQAQVGACIVGEARLVEVIERYGYELYRECCDALLTQGEAYARAKVREFPDGHYAAELFLDDDGVNRDEPVRITVTLIVDESDMVVDLTGSSGPCAGPYNMNPNYTNAICRIAFKSLTSPHQPSNEGHFRPVRALVPDQSVFNAQRPSPVFWGFKTAGTLVDCIRRAATQAVVEQPVAGNYGWSCGAHVFGEHPADGGFFAMVDEAGGGWGARPGADGEDAMVMGGIRNNPVEVSERKFPVKVEAYELRAGSGGAGAFRGGLGVRRSTRLLADVRLVANFERSECLPWGLGGGQPGQGSYIEIHGPDDRVERLQKCTNRALPAGSRMVYFTGGGGGYGDPRERAVERVLDDVRRGYITPAEAEGDYAVCINQDTGRVDEAETRALRTGRGRSDDTGDQSAEGAIETRHPHTGETREG